MLVAGCGSPVRQRHYAEVDPLVFDAHEFNLIDVYPGGQRSPTHRVRDSILYLHYASGNQAHEVSLIVRVPDGSLSEVWPLDPLAQNNSDHRRGGVAASMNQGLALRETSFRIRFGPSGNRYCDRSHLPLFLTPDPECVDVGGVRAPFLSYRNNNASQPVLPVTIRTSAHVSGSSAETAQLEINRSEGLVEHGENTRVPRGYWIDYSASPPMVQSVPLVSGATLAFEDHALPAEANESALRQDMAEIGLTPDEANAFMRAWRAELLLGELPTGERQTGQVFLYWLEDDDVNRISGLAFTPEPRWLVRATLVRLHIT